MRSDLTLARIERSWTDWRGRAVEPLVRDALARLLPAQGIARRAVHDRLGQLPVVVALSGAH